MKIWVDADACPVVIKEILFKSAERTGLQLILVANKRFQIPKSSFISFYHVSSGLDVADDEIINKLDAGDLVVTGDIPLASRVVERGGLALNPRGEEYTAENIKERLSTRDFLEGLRSSGIETGGPSALGPRHVQTFANKLDQLLTKFKNNA